MNNFNDKKEQFKEIRNTILLAYKSGIMDEELIDKMILSLGYYYASLYKHDFLKYTDNNLPPYIDFIETVNDRVNSLENKDKEVNIK